MTDENTLPAGGDGPSRAVDGGRVPGACNTLAEFIRSLEDGQFDADCYEKLKGLSAAMNDHAKGKVPIPLDFIQGGTVVEIKSAFKAVEPVDRRPKSVMWTTEDHRFTRTRPGQRELFGIRDVSGGASARDVG